MISVLNPQLDPTYADNWGEYLPFYLESWWPIINAGCYVPRWFQAPTNALEVMAVGDYNEYALQIPPGSFIMSILHNAPICSGACSSGTFTVMITDTAIDYKWFSNPVPDAFFYRNYLTTGRNGHVLPKPYPVISPGTFLIERWCTAPGPCELLFACAVPEGAGL